MYASCLNTKYSTFANSIHDHESSLCISSEDDNSSSVLYLNKMMENEFLLADLSLSLQDVHLSRKSSIFYICTPNIDEIDLAHEITRITGLSYNILFRHIWDTFLMQTSEFHQSSHLDCCNSSAINAVQVGFCFRLFFFGFFVLFWGRGGCQEASKNKM